MIFQSASSRKGRPAIAGFVALLLFALVVFALGGSARQDVSQLAALRPLAALFLIPAALLFSRSNFAPIKPLGWILGLLGAWMAMQLVPLPPWLWAGAGREAVAQLDTVLLGSELWRPISLVPQRGWNALGSLVVPLMALVLVAGANTSSRQLLFVVAGFGTIHALLCVMQLATGGSDALYFYRIANFGAGTGVFANANHSAVFSGIMLLIVGRLAMQKTKGSPPWLTFVYPVWALLFLLTILTNGSRAGLLVGFAALFACVVMAWIAISKGPSKTRSKPRSAKQSSNKLVNLLFAAGLVVVAGLIGLFASTENLPGLSEFSDNNSFEDLRWALLDPLGEMVAQFWILGSGFGTFASAYNQFEPTELMRAVYVNQAHNDWLQWVIEGGLPAIILLAVFWGMLVRKLRAIIKQEGLLSQSTVFWVALLGLISAASLVDYPLRTPIYQMCFVWLICALFMEGRKAEIA